MYLVESLLIYIVDDDDAVRTSLMRIIRSAGLEPRGFCHIEEFMDSIEREKPDCVLLDITMPGDSGLQVQSMLAKRGIMVPTIAVSARDEDTIRETARKMGARMYLSKPVDDQALLDAISWVIGNARAHGRGQ